MVTNTGTVVNQGGHNYAVYTGTTAPSAQLLIDQHMLHVSPDQLKTKKGRMANKTWALETSAGRMIRHQRASGFVQAQLLDFAGDGVAADAQFLRRLDAAAPRGGECCLNQAGFKTPGERVPHIGAACVEQS